MTKHASNYREYAVFLKGSNQPQVTAEQMVDYLAPDLGRNQHIPFKIFDVGCGVVTFTFLYLKSLNKSVSTIQVTAIEPETPAYNVFAQRVAERGHNWIQHQNITFQEFLKSNASNSSLYDFILFAHCFYHFPKEGWKSILDGTQRLLRVGGLVHIINDSHQGEAYKLKGKVTRGNTATLEYGYLHSAEDIENVLARNGIKFSETSFSVHLYIKDNEQRLEMLARHLAFLYRTFPEKIYPQYRNDLVQMLEESRKVEGRYTIENKVKIITFKKPSQI